MPEEIVTAKVEEKAAEKAETQETKVETTAETPDELKRRLHNKEEEAARLHAKLEKYEQDAEEKRKASLTNEQRLQEERDAAMAKAKTLELSQLKRDVADKAGLPLAFADRLKGETPEELAADAQAMLGAMPKPPDPKKPQQTKIGNTSPGEYAVASSKTDDERRNFLFGPR